MAPLDTWAPGTAPIPAEFPRESIEVTYYQRIMISVFSKEARDTTGGRPSEELINGNYFQHFCSENLQHGEDRLRETRWSNFYRERIIKRRRR